MKFQQQVFHNPHNQWASRAAKYGAESAILYHPLTIGHYLAEKEYCVRRQGYDNMLIAYTIAGKGTLEYRQQKYEILPGMLFLIDCDEPHVYGTLEENWEFYWMHFSGGESRSITRHLLSRSGPVHRCGDQAGFFQSLYRQTEHFSRESQIQISQRIYAFLMQILLSAEKKQTQPQPILRALAHMEAHFREEIHLDDLAAAAHVSKYYLARLFKNQLEQSPYAYLISLRLRHAKSLLLSSETPIAQIADECGFSDLHGFFYHFQQEEGCTPLQYRKKHTAP